MTPITLYDPKPPSGVVRFSIFIRYERVINDRTLRRRWIRVYDAVVRYRLAGFRPMEVWLDELRGIYYQLPEGIGR